jgi:gliding motility-associated-like protein
MCRKLLIILLLIIVSLKANAVSITSFSPTIGSVGTLVTINGTNLNNPTAFSIGGVSAIVISNTGSTLVGMVMPGATVGAVSITTAGGTATSVGSFTVSPTLFPVQQLGGKLAAADADGTAYQGSAVAVSADGNTAVVGGDQDNGYVGAAWIYIRNGNSWVQQGKKLVGADYSGIMGQQGAAVAISADGNTVIVGAPHDAVNMGAAYVYTRSGTTWTQQGSKLVGNNTVGGTILQGISVALSADGNTAIIGGSQDGGDHGSVWIFTRSGGVWAQQTKLSGSGGSGAMDQGRSVALSADGNTAIIGGYYDNNFLGAAWIFTRSGNTWTQQGTKLVGTNTLNNPYQVQGTSVALSADGYTAIVGGTSNSDHSGGAWIYTRNGNTWTQQGNELTLRLTGAWEGMSVSLSADGNAALIGSHVLDDYQGAAWVYARNGGNWLMRQELQGGDNVGPADQGISVSLSANGVTAIIGGSGDNSEVGAAWIFDAPISTPEATTQPATLVTGIGATLNGTVNDNGNLTTVSFEYGTNADLSGATTAVLSTGTSPMAAGTGTTSFSSVLTGLTQTTTYYFRIIGANGFGTDKGAILSFITPVLQVITFAPLPTVPYGSADIMPNATSTNNTIGITYTSSNKAIATIVAGNIHITGAGTVTITASQAGDLTYGPAAPVTQTLTVTPVPLTITANNQTRVYGANPAFTATCTGLVNGDTQSSLATQPVFTTTANTTSPPGTYPISVSGAYSPNYVISYAGGTLTITKAPQTINFGPIPIQRIGTPSITLNITASSGLPVTISSADQSIATVNGSVVKLLGLGSTTITAHQAGDDNYLPADTSQVLDIVTTPVAPNTFTPNSDGINDTWNIKYIEGYPDCTVKIYNRNGQLVYNSIGYGIAWDGRYKNQPLPVGTYYYMIDLKHNLGTLSGSVTVIR